MTSWVAAHLTGGIGNRLFQHAAAMGLAEKYTLPCVFLKSAISPNDHGPADNIVKLYPKIPTVESKDHHTKMIEPRDDCFRYIPFPEEKPGDRLIVEGYRQTALYFPKDKALLAPSWDDLLPAEKRLDLLKKYNLASLIERRKAWWLHVRLGDYKILPHHQIPILGYYLKCLDQIPKGSPVYLFSDEPHLCNQWFEQETKKRGLESRVILEEEIPSLFLMSTCWGGAVVANSTFSWWGAFFAYLSNPDSSTYKAFYPSVWGQGLPPAVDINPPWGTTIQIA